MIQSTHFQNLSSKVSVPDTVKERFARFQSEGSLGQGAERVELTDMDFQVNLPIKLRDFTDVIAHDDKPGDRNAAPNALDLSPEVASRVGFGPTRSLVGVYEGSQADPDAALLHIRGEAGAQERYYFLEAGPDGNGGGKITILDAVVSPRGQGVIQGTVFAIGADKVSGYTEAIFEDWHVAR